MKIKEDSERTNIRRKKNQNEQNEIDQENIREYRRSLIEKSRQPDTSKFYLQFSYCANAGKLHPPWPVFSHLLSLLIYDQRHC